MATDATSDGKPALTREQSRRVDQVAIDEFGMLGLVLMENAGRGCADKLIEIGIDGPVVICCGKGNNGGDGFVLARHLDAQKLVTKVLLWSDPNDLGGDAAANYRILRQTSVPVHVFDAKFSNAQLASAIGDADWVVDALLGTGSRGEPRAPFDRVIEGVNEISVRKLAIDIPSGLDCDTGRPSNNTFRADHTLTFVAAKIGMRQPSAMPFVGQIHVLGIGVPPEVLHRVLQS